MANTASVPNNRMNIKSNNTPVDLNMDTPNTESSKITTFFNKYKWYILAVLIVVISVVVYQYYNPFESKEDTSTTSIDKDSAVSSVDNVESGTEKGDE